MNVYIRGTGNISPQDTFEQGKFPEEIRTFDTPYLYAVEPDYKSYIKPILLRRMSRVLKMGVVAANYALREANVEKPDAIITATGLGMLEDTEKFLGSMIDNGERLLNPTAFIQSTHNTVGAHIAVMLNCNHYNLTYVHGFVSFESALIDTVMWLQEHPDHNVLLGGVEELTDMHFRISDSAGFWKKGQVDSRRLLEYGSAGTIAGEGAAFFVVSSIPGPGSCSQVKAVKTLYKPEGKQELEKNILSFIESAGLRLEDIDLVLMGFNGDERYDGTYHELEGSLFSGMPTGYFKHLCGEHYLASSFGFWLACMILQQQQVPGHVIHKGNPPESVENILIYNQNKMVNHSLMMISSC